MKRLVMFLVLIPGCMIFVASLLAVEHYISAPLVIFVIFKAAMGKWMREQFCSKVDLGHYMTQLGIGNFLASFVCIVG